MVKAILRRILFYTFALFVTPILLSGLVLRGGFQTIVVGAIVLTILMFALKPVLQILSFPLNAITFGFFSFVVNAVILFVVTFFIPQVQVYAFTLPKLSFLGFVVPAIALNKWFAYLLVSLMISGIYSLLSWVTTE